MKLRVLSRLLRIQRVLVKHGLDEIILATHLFRPVRFAFYLSPATWFQRSRRDAPRGERLRKALEELGPIFMKFGQTLSTRRDLLPRDIADELEKLQDEVPPFPGEQARAIAEAALARPLNEIFARFDQEPLAAAHAHRGVGVAGEVEGRPRLVRRCLRRTLCRQPRVGRPRIPPRHHRLGDGALLRDHLIDHDHTSPFGPEDHQSRRRARVRRAPARDAGCHQRNPAYRAARAGELVRAMPGEPLLDGSVARHAVLLMPLSVHAGGVAQRSGARYSAGDARMWAPCSVLGAASARRSRPTLDRKS